MRSKGAELMVDCAYDRVVALVSFDLLRRRRPER
jgi:hypothetical protein